MKVIEINGQSYELETRYCAVNKCGKSFRTLKSSPQSICCIFCYESEHGQWKYRKQDPEIQRKPKSEGKPYFTKGPKRGHQKRNSEQ